WQASCPMPRAVWCSTSGCQADLIENTVRRRHRPPLWTDIAIEFQGFPFLPTFAPTDKEMKKSKSATEIAAGFLFSFSKTDPVQTRTPRVGGGGGRGASVARRRIFPARCEIAHTSPRWQLVLERVVVPTALEPGENMAP